MSVMLNVIIFTLGFFIGLMVASAVKDDEKVKVKTKGPKPAQPAQPTTPVSPNAILFRCPKCGRCAGRKGPYLTVHALHGHMRACPGEWP